MRVKLIKYQWDTKLVKPKDVFLQYTQLIFLDNTITFGKLSLNVL